MNIYEFFTNCDQMKIVWAVIFGMDTHIGHMPKTNIHATLFWVYKVKIIAKLI